MKTDDLIALLAAGEGPVPRHAVCNRMAVAVLGGLTAALLLTITLYGVRSDITEVAQTPLFWGKVAFPTSLALIGLWLTSRLARPGGRALQAGRCLACHCCWSGAGRR